MATNPDVRAATLRLSQSSPASKVLLGGSVFFFVVSFLAWQKACFGDICGTATAWHGVGIIAALLAVAILVLEGLRLFGVQLGLDPGVQARIVAGLGGGVLLFTIIKIFVDNEFRAYGSWLGIVAAVIVAVGGVMALGEANSAAARARREQRFSAET
jgi:hypothetical protein